MLQIRQNIFETNSSSVHAMSICSEEEFDKWVKGELLYSTETNKFYTEQEAREEILTYYENSPQKPPIIDSDLFDYFDFKDYKNYGEGFEYFEEKYTTKSGDKIVIFGYHGWDA